MQYIRLRKCHMSTSVYMPVFFPLSRPIIYILYAALCSPNAYQEGTGVGLRSFRKEDRTTMFQKGRQDDCDVSTLQYSTCILYFVMWTSYSNKIQEDEVGKTSSSGDILESANYDMISLTIHNNSSSSVLDYCRHVFRASPAILQ